MFAGLRVRGVAEGAAAAGVGGTVGAMLGRDVGDDASGVGRGVGIMVSPTNPFDISLPTPLSEPASRMALIAKRSTCARDGFAWWPRA